MSDKVTQLTNLLTNFNIQITADSGVQHQFFSSEFSSSASSLRYQQHRNLGTNMMYGAVDPYFQVALGLLKVR